jgi:sugar lactone lactonase YvrE
MAGSHQIWTVDTNGEAAPFAGSAAEAIVDGPRASSAFAQPSGLATDGASLLVADSESSAIRRIDLESGDVRTIVGTGLFDFGLRDGVGDEARLQHPLGIAWRDGLLYIADAYNGAIRIVDPRTREATTWLGADAGLWEPGGLAIAGDRVWIADTNNHRIVRATIGSTDVRPFDLRSG